MSYKRVFKLVQPCSNNGLSWSIFVLQTQRLSMFSSICDYKSNILIQNSVSEWVETLVQIAREPVFCLLPVVIAFVNPSATSLQIWTSGVIVAQFKGDKTNKFFTDYDSSAPCLYNRIMQTTLARLPPTAVLFFFFFYVSPFGHEEKIKLLLLFYGNN